MNPYYTDSWLTIYAGDCRTVLAELPDESVHCVVTSPPYWGLRDYGHDGQLGLEPTPEQYVANLVAVFREVRRVLRRDGTLWLNLGDSYSLNQRAGAPKTGSYAPERPGWSDTLHERTIAPGLKPKDLVGIPWRVAFALQADGWYLRSDIIWSKPNPMPESVTDRPTKAHEYLFLLSKSARYFFDQEAVREPVGAWTDGRVSVSPHDGNSGRVLAEGHRKQELRVYDTIKGANLRSVWTIPTRPYPGAHFAVFPPELPERCIKAGTSERGVCPECGAPWERVVDKSRSFESGSGRAGNLPIGKNGERLQGGGETGDVRRGPVLHVETTGWRPTCSHPCDICGEPDHMHAYKQPVPAVILDPFAGSGTVGMVAAKLSRRAILIDLNPEYIKQQLVRNAQTPLGLEIA